MVASVGQVELRTSLGSYMALKRAAKITKHASSCEAQGFSFLPLVFDVFGARDDETDSVLKALARKLASRVASDTSYSQEVSWLRQSCSVSIWRSNGEAINQRLMLRG